MAAARWSAKKQQHKVSRSITVTITSRLDVSTAVAAPNGFGLGPMMEQAAANFKHHIIRKEICSDNICQ